MKDYSHGSIHILTGILLSVFLVACDNDDKKRSNSNSGLSTGPDVVFKADRNIAKIDELYAAYADGSTIINLSGVLTTNGKVKKYALSPDRKWVAFTATKDLITATELYIVPSLGGAVVKMHNDFTPKRDVSDFKWSADSTKVAYAADQDVDNQTEIYVSPLAGASGNVQIHPDFKPNHKSLGKFEWAPDSSRVAYIAEQDTLGVLELYTSLADGTGTPSKINSDLQLGQNVTEIFWSPNSQKLAYIIASPTTPLYELFSASPTGSDRVSLSKGGNLPFANTSWAPDSSRILYNTDQDTAGVIDAYTTTADGTANVKINLIGGAVYKSEWAPDSSRIAYTAATTRTSSRELFTYHLGQALAVKISGPIITGGNVVNFKWSPNSAFIAYIAGQETVGIKELFISSASSADGNVKINGTIIPSAGDVDRFDWAPNSSRIAYLADQDTDRINELYTSLPTGSADNIKINKPLPSGSKVTSFSWLLDSAGLVYLSDQVINKTFELFVSPATGLNNVKVSGDITATGGKVQDYLTQ